MTTTTVGSRPGRLNRTLLLLLGLVGLATGAGGLGVATGRLPGPAADEPVLPGPVLDRLLGLAWLPWATAALGLVVALLALRWLLAQLPRRTGSERVVLPAPEGRGVTRLDGSVVADAVERDVEAYAGVRSAHAVVSGGRTGSRLVLSLVVDPGTDVRALQGRVRQHAQARLARALGAEQVTSRVLVDVARTGSGPTVL